MKNFTFSRKLKASLCAIVLFLSFSAFAVFFLSRDAVSFRRFCNSFFASELSGNTLNMHYTIANPSSYGIHSYTPALPSYSKERRQNSLEELASAIETLHTIDASKLNAQNAYIYRLLLPYLENEQSGTLLYFYANPLSPSSGMQSQLPILLAEYAFRSKQDIEDYLALLDQTDSYFEGIVSYLKDQSAQGLFMPDYSVDKVIAQCDTIMDSNSLESGRHFLNTTFEERLDGLMEQDIITEKEKAAYLSENSRLLNTVMLPAYQKMGDELLLLKGSGKNENGLSYYPNGKDYYLYLIQSNTGSYRSIKEIKLLLLQDFEKSFQSMRSLLQSNPGLLSSAGLVPSPFAYSEPADMLKNLQQMMAADFPALSDVAENNMPVCTVKSISENLQEYCSPAFYLTPPLDDNKENVIYINPKNNPYGVELYTTLAHEGYPGHLYQTVYSQLFFQKTGINPIRCLLSYGGYVEGWAMYVELKSYDYAKTLMKQSAPETEALYELYKLDRKIQLSLYSLLDIAIHYEGATYAQAHKMLSSVGISEPSTTRSIYEYIVEEPTNYLKYYLGYLEIIHLKSEAKKLWGDGYSEYRFHKFYLENGPADFTNLQLQLKQPSNSPANQISQRLHQPLGYFYSFVIFCSFLFPVSQPFSQYIHPQKGFPALLLSAYP